MARKLGARGRESRSSGMDLDLFSSKRALSSKCKLDTRPGSAAKRRPRSTEYGVQLEMKQAIKAYYGVLEKQFKNYYHRAGRMSGSTSDNLALFLERRLDNIVYRMGFAPTRRAARQLVTHGHVRLCGPKDTQMRRVNIPSCLVDVGTKIAVSEVAMSIPAVSESLSAAAKAGHELNWLEVEHQAGQGVYQAHPPLDFLHRMFKFNLVIEFYSK